MNLLFDTNIILAFARDKSGHNLIDFLNPEKSSVYISIVSLAEIQSISIQNNWGYSKLQKLEEFFNLVSIINVSDLLVPNYVLIDAFSQRNSPDFDVYPFKTPRNMGKNDLWIAATASVLNLKLITTDSDFDHLEESFLKLWKINPKELSSLLGK